MAVFIALLEAMRPRQWTKNVFVLAAIAFGQKLDDRGAVEWTLAAFIIFCFLSSSVYLVNDIMDAERDRQHPTKRKRPMKVPHSAAGLPVFLLYCPMYQTSSPFGSLVKPV